MDKVFIQIYSLLTSYKNTIFCVLLVILSIFFCFLARVLRSYVTVRSVPFIYMCIFLLVAHVWYL